MPAEMLQPQIRQPILDASRLSRAKVEKFLIDGERIIFTTKRWLTFNTQKRKAHVTNMRLLFYRQEGKLLGLVKQDRLDEIYINSIRKLSLVEQGLINKSIILQIDELNIRGDRSDLLGMYKALQSARASR